MSRLPDATVDTLWMNDVVIRIDLAQALVNCRIRLDDLFVERLKRNVRPELAYHVTGPYMDSQGVETRLAWLRFFTEMDRGGILYKELLATFLEYGRQADGAIAALRDRTFTTLAPRYPGTAQRVRDGHDAAVTAYRAAHPEPASRTAGAQRLGYVGGPTSFLDSTGEVDVPKLLAHLQALTTEVGDLTPYLAML